MWLGDSPLSGQEFSVAGRTVFFFFFFSRMRCQVNKNDGKNRGTGTMFAAHHVSWVI